MSMRDARRFRAEMEAMDPQNPTKKKLDLSYRDRLLVYNLFYPTLS